MSYTFAEALEVHIELLNKAYADILADAKDWNHINQDSGDHKKHMKKFDEVLTDIFRLKDAALVAKHAIKEREAHK